MLKRRAKQVLAGLCAALLLVQSVDGSALTVRAAQDAAEAVPKEEALGGLWETDNTVVTDAGEADGMERYENATVQEISQDPISHGGGDGEDWTDLSAGVRVSKEGVIQVYAGADKGYEDFGKIEDGVLTVNASVTGISVGMFKEWEDVKELRFEANSGVKLISISAFENCKNLEKIDLSNCSSLADIGENAFAGCAALQTIVFHDNLQSIRKNAFMNCTSLTGIVLTPGLINVEDSAFKGCSSLSEVKLETSNVRVTASAGIFQNCDIKTVTFALRNVTGDHSQDSIIVPANLFKGAGFAENADIVIPSNIQEIGEGAFNGSNLTQITFENTVDRPSALTTIGKDAFKGTKLSKVTFPETLQNIGESAFENCVGLGELTIPNSVTSLGRRAFYGCTDIASLKLSNATTVIGDSLFENCTSLIRVELPEGPAFTGNSEFKGCASLSEIIIPDTVEKIGDSAFASCTSLTSVKLPDSVTVLGNGAFASCTSLLDITYSPNLKEIGDRAFFQCSRLTSNVFPDTLEKIGASAFEDCQQLDDLTIPANVTNIGGRAFWQCTGIDVLTIAGDKINACGQAIFYGCYLKKVNFPEGITVIPGNLFSQATFAADFVMTIPNTVTEVGDSAFAGSSSIKVNLPVVEFEAGTKLEKIGRSAFQHCTAIESFTIPESTKEIGANAFEGCIKLSSIVIPENVTSIGASAFSGCSVLSEITYNAIAVTTKNVNIFAKCNVKKILIGEKVRVFPDNLFRGAQFSTNTSTGEEEMITIRIPASVESIGDYALPSIANLQQVIFEEGGSITRIGQYAFYQCVNLESCNLPDSVTSIGNFAFDGCAKLGSGAGKSFTIPASLETLGDNAFSNCPALTEAVIPEGVAKIGSKAFLNDTGLTSVLLQGGKLTEIGVSAFEGCIGLKQISIPNGVVKIGASAFKNCVGLEKVVIPASVTSIGNDAFAGCVSALYLVVSGSYAEEWLQKNHLEGRDLQTITYVLNGGSNAPQNPAGYEPGDDFEFAPASRKGYKFIGWYLDANFGTAITGVKGQTENLTVYAKWEIETYTITYVLNGGTNDKDNPTQYTVEDTFQFKDATMDGASFEGWYTDLSNVRTKVTGIKKGDTGDKTLYAKWSRGVTLEPTASIPSGTAVKAGTKLFLKSVTPGAYIYYTLDGSEPGEQSAKYLDGIVIDRALTVRAIAVKDGCDPSGIVEFVYSVIDETKEWGDILPEDQELFGSAAEAPEGIWVAGVNDDTVYSGKKITFDLRVYDHKKLLKEKTDYTVKYSNNTNAAEKNAARKAPAVTVTAKGNYKGKVSIAFTIKPKDIGGGEFSAEDLTVQASGKLQKPSPVLYCGKTKLKIKKDYQLDSVSAGGYTAAGTYEVRLQGVGNYTGERTIQFTLANGSPISKAKIKGLVKMPYTGSAVTQNFTVSVGSTILKEGEDYETEYRDNVDAGSATVIITGKNNYFGTKKATFKIMPIATMNKTSIALDRTTVDYTGQAYEIGSGINVTASYNSQPLKEGTDYTCTYKSNVNAGKATITFTGMGGYSGSVKKTFKIKGADFRTISPLVTVDLLDDQGNVKEDDSYTYVKGGVKPDVMISYNGRILKAGTDYTVSYKNNQGKGTGTIEIKGKKNFTGKFTRQFTITQQKLEELSALATDVVWKNQAGLVENSKITVKDLNGGVLTEGTDYRVTFAYENSTRLEDGSVKKAGSTVGQNDIVPPETLIRAKIAGSGNYSGSTFTIFRVCKKSIASASVKVQQQYYTGFEVQPGKDQITVKAGGQILSENDYEIVGYENNVKKGSGKVIIRGLGNYGGTKTVSFKIAQKPFVLSGMK